MAEKPITLDKEALQVAAKAIFVRVDSMGRAITLAEQCITAYLAALQKKGKR